MRWGLAAALCLGIGAGASAQDVVGTAIVDGRRVELLSDRTWREASGQPEGCSVVDEPVSFCGSPTRWRRSTSRNPEIDAYYVASDNEFAQIIVETLGRNAGLDLEGFRGIVLEIAGSAMGVRPSEVPVLDTRNVEVDGLDAETVVYQIDVSGVPVVFANTLALGDAFAFQAQTWMAGQTFTDEHRELHDEFLSGLRVEASAE